MRYHNAWTLVLVVSFLVASTPLQAQTSYYLWNGTSLNPVRNGDPAAVNAVDWQVWLYRKGRTTGGKDYWGIISGESAAKVMSELKRDQEFERRYVKWCGCDWGSDTNFNALGPIALIYPFGSTLSSFHGEFLSLISDEYQRMESIRKVFLTARELRSTSSSTNPFKNVGSVLKEYTDNLKEAQKQLRKLTGQVFRSNRLPDVLLPLTEVNAELERAKAVEPDIKAALGASRINVQPSPSGTVTSSGRNDSEGSSAQRGPIIHIRVPEVTVTTESGTRVLEPSSDAEIDLGKAKERQPDSAADASVGTSPSVYVKSMCLDRWGNWAHMCCGQAKTESECVSSSPAGQPCKAIDPRQQKQSLPKGGASPAC